MVGVTPLPGPALLREAVRRAPVSGRRQAPPESSRAGGVRIRAAAAAPHPVERVQTVVDDTNRQLRVLIANERRDRLAVLARVVAGLGHEVIASEIDVEEVGAVTAREQPDVALVGLGLSSDHALELIGKIVHESACPVIAMLSAEDPAYVREAARRGVFAYIVDTTPEELQGAIDITLQRFAEYHSLQGAFGRRALIEQAKGILMTRHSIDADRAFDLLRDHSRRNGRKVADVAAAIIDSHVLLIPPARPPDR